MVNGVAHFVHASVDDHLGFANKNVYLADYNHHIQTNLDFDNRLPQIGDAFLVAWKPDTNDGFDAQQTASAALRSFIRIPSGPHFLVFRHLGSQ